MKHAQASVCSFESIEQVDEVTHAMGWHTEYRQLEPGAFSSRFTILEGETWFLLEERSSRHLEVHAPAPDGMYVLAVAEGDPGVIDGQPLTPDHVFVLHPDSAVRAVLPAGIRVTEIGIAADRFEDAARAVGPDVLVPRTRATTIATAPGRLAGVRRAMRAALFAPSNQETAREEAVSNILADLVTVVADRGQEPVGRGLHRASAQRALGRAREYIEANLGETIRVASLCRYAGTTLRSLERIFARELGMSPQQYVKARRLNAVRRRLLAAGGDPGFRVTQVALDHGFAHLGRFAGDYRRHFGESPRETLSSR